MRGQSTSGATATEQALKAKFASVRIQELQNEFARFASDCQSLKAEIISKHYDPETILKCSNAQYMVQGDQQAAQQAIELIKSDVYQYRIEVKPESVAMADMAAIKQERSEFLMAISQFFQSSAPILQQAPWAAPYLIQILQWAMAGFRGGSTVESVLDQMAMAANQQMMQAQMQPAQMQPAQMQPMPAAVYSVAAVPVSRRSALNPPNGTLMRVEFTTLAKLTKMPCAVSGLR